MQPYLESLPNYTDGAPPWIPTNRGHGITSRSLKHDHEIPPRDLKELCTDPRPIMLKQSNNIYHANNLRPTFINHTHSYSNVESIPTHPSQTMNIEFHLIPIPCHFNYQPPTISYMSHAKFMLNLSIIDHKPFHSYPFAQFMLLKVIESIHKFKLK